jgi:magnesium transporter
MAAPSSRRVPILFAASALRPYTSSSRAAALALPETLFAAFFVGGLLLANDGAFGPWIVLAAVLLAFVVRRIDIESWTLFIPGGLTGRVERAFGPRAATATACTTLLERILLAALACVAFGHYCAAFVLTLTEYSVVLRTATAADLASLMALVMLGWLWLRARRGPLMTPSQRARYVWIAVAILLLLFIAAVSAAIARRAIPPWPALTGWWTPSASWRSHLQTVLWTVIAVLASLGLGGSAIGVADSIPRAAHELEPPRIVGLRRTVRMTGVAALLFTAGLTFLLAAFANDAARLQWTTAPLGWLAVAVTPHWLGAVLRPLVVVAAALLLAQTARAGMWGAESALLRLAERGAISPRFQEQDPRFGRYQAAINTVALSIVVAVLLSSASLDWLATAYATAMLWTLAIQAAALGRLSIARGRRAIKFVGVVLVACAVAMLLRAEPGAVAATAVLLSMAAVFARHVRRVEEPTADADAESLLVSSQILSSDLPARPGSILVPVRNPHLLAHLTAALRSSREHEIVVMTARLYGSDGMEEAESNEPTAAERALFARVIAIAERFGRPVRLVIVPSHDVFDAVISTVVRIHATDVYVGESTSISADAQARRLGEAWERAELPDLQVRLVIFHPSGRSDIFHLGPHAPELGARDLELIHRMWLDAAKSAGPHIHHHDIVRAALNTMADQLSGPDREDALKAIRAVARPADELAAVLRERDYQRLRDMVRNRPASDLAELLADLSLDEQAIAFRLLPRKEAAETFEYLEQDAREALLKTLSKEDVAAILNNMAPDDRTDFLEELPATVTRELLSLLSAQERSIAVTLLGYPERSIGRLMTPDYLSVREGWTVQQVLDYVRTHGHDSETLNVIYVVDDEGMLIDDVRIREILLADPARRVTEIMDRHFVALKATDDQQEAVTAFRQFDRTALPVTDTSGMLIGIVTVDDVLDVVETEATEDIQRIGGSEALDEPYMEISFPRMIQKRAGWLTALFLGEMLTATAMGFFENEINKAVVLALFVPLIISSGGNSGSQASTLVIRALALGELTLRDWWRVMRREMGAGLALGTILAVIGFLRITVWSAFSNMYGEHWLLVACTVAFALIGVVMWGTLIGSLLPLVLRRLGFDPATSSAPFVATLVDVTGLVIYFSVALVVLRGTLL